MRPDFHHNVIMIVSACLELEMLQTQSIVGLVQTSNLVTYLADTFLRSHSGVRGKVS